MSNELKDFDIRSLSKDDFKHNVYDKYLQNICKRLEDRFPDAGLLEASIFQYSIPPIGQVNTYQVMVRNTSKS